MHRAGVLGALPGLGKASEEASSPCIPLILQSTDSNPFPGLGLWTKSARWSRGRWQETMWVSRVQTTRPGASVPCTAGDLLRVGELHCRLLHAGTATASHGCRDRASPRGNPASRRAQQQEGESFAAASSTGRDAATGVQVITDIIPHASTAPPRAAARGGQAPRLEVQSFSIIPPDIAGPGCVGRSGRSRPASEGAAGSLDTQPRSPHAKPL